MKQISVLIYVLFTINCVVVNSQQQQEKAETFKECFDKDSISCLQLKVYDIGKKIFEQPSIKLFGGLSLDEEIGDINNTKAESKEFSFDDNNSNNKSTEILDDKLKNADNFVARQSLLEDYFQQKVADLWAKRSLKWNALEAGKFALRSFKQSRNYYLQNNENNVEEGRGKLKMIKMMVPWLMALKLKFIAMLKISALVVLALAKKAIVAAVVSLFISSYIGLQSLLSKKKKHGYNHHHHVDYHTLDAAPHPYYHQAIPPTYYHNYPPQLKHIHRVGLTSEEEPMEFQQQQQQTFAY